MRGEVGFVVFNEPRIEEILHNAVCFHLNPDLGVKCKQISEEPMINFTFSRKMGYNTCLIKKPLSNLNESG